MVINQNKTALPKITFNLAVYNEEKRLTRCLKSIRDLNYPQEKIEILLLDGGSTDKTPQIAKEYNAEIIFNEKKLPEPGFAKGYQAADGDYIVFMAADNVLYDKNWLKKIIQPFLDDKNVSASFSKVVNDEKDNIWSKYLNEDTDPFNAFLFGNSSHPDKFKNIYQCKYKNKNYVIYQYSVVDYPLIALAQGTTLKKGLFRNQNTIYDDITPLIDIIKQNKDIAYVTNTGIRHYSLSGFHDYCRKFNKRIYNSLKTESYFSREKHNSFHRKIKRYIFFVYTLFVFPVVFHSIYLLFKKKKIYMLLHPIACGIICYYIIVNFIKVKILKK